MTARKKAPRKWLFPSIVVVCIGVGLTIPFVKRSRQDSRAEAERVEVEAQKTQPSAGGQSLATNLSLLTTNPTSVQTSEERVVALITEGNELLAQGNHAAAVQKFEQAIAISPEEEDLHYNLAIALAKLGKTADARKHYEEALRIFPDYAEAHNNLGNLLMNENNLEEASAHFREAIKSMPDNASFHNNLGTALGRQKRIAEAIVEFEEAVRRAPTYVEARVNLANTFLITGRVDEAISQLDEALRLRPGFAPAVQTMQRARQRQEAIKAGK
jgi:Tfp pilus assembly protein PilF